MRKRSHVGVGSVALLPRDLVARGDDGRHGDHPRSRERLPVTLTAGPLASLRCHWTNSGFVRHASCRAARASSSGVASLATHPLQNLAEQANSCSAARRLNQGL